jgi:hypothetical protein
MNGTVVESSWNVMAHGDAQEGKWRGNRRMEWVANTLHTTSEHGVYPALLPLTRTPRLPVVDWNDAPADLNGFFRFTERRNLVSARVPSHFKRSLLQLITFTKCTAYNALVRAVGGSNKDVLEIVSRPTQNSLATHRLRNIGLTKTMIDVS